MLHLVILADVVLAEAADEDAAPVVPHATLTLATHTVKTRARAPVSLQTLLPVTDPRLAVIAHRPHQVHASGEVSGVLDDTITGLLLALRLPTVPTHRQLLSVIAEVTKGTVLLDPLAPVARHQRVTGEVYQTARLQPSCLYLLLDQLHLVSLLAGSGLLLGHGCVWARAGG